MGSLELDRGSLVEVFVIGADLEREFVGRSDDGRLRFWRFGRGECWSCEEEGACSFLDYVFLHFIVVCLLLASLLSLILCFFLALVASLCIYFLCISYREVKNLLLSFW